jgi:hypothetical protein
MTSEGGDSQNLPLLKLLKAQINEVARVTNELQQAELEENWVEFEKLQQLHTQLLLNERRNTSTAQINSNDDFTFDMEQARRKVASIVAVVETRRRSAALLKKRKCVIKGTQYA